MVTYRPYQQSGAAFLAQRPVGLLLDEVRVGKTYTGLLAHHQAGGQRLAVLAPAIARESWRRHFAAAGIPGELRVESYERYALNHGVQEMFRAFRPDTLILDEAQRVRSPQAKRTRAVYGPRWNRVGGLAERVDRLWGLSGTLAPNHLGETWTHLHAMGRTTLSYTAFLHQYCHLLETMYGPKVVGIRREHVEEYKGLIAPIALRRRLRDLFPDMPRLAWNTLPMEFPAAARKELELALREAKLDQLGRSLDRMTEEEAEAKLAAHDLGASYIQALLARIKAPLVLEEAVELLEGGVEKLVIFAWHHEMMGALGRGLTKYGARVIDGNTPEKRRWEIMDAFQEGTSCRVLICQIRTAGEAIALHAARVILVGEMPWSAGALIQAVARIIDTQSQDQREVLITTLAGTIDDAVAGVVIRKIKQQEVLNSLQEV